MCKVLPPLPCPAMPASLPVYPSTYTHTDSSPTPHPFILSPPPPPTPTHTFTLTQRFSSPASPPPTAAEIHATRRAIRYRIGGETTITTTTSSSQALALSPLAIETRLLHLADSSSAAKPSSSFSARRLLPSFLLSSGGNHKGEEEGEEEEEVGPLALARAEPLAVFGLWDGSKGMRLR